MTDPNVFRGLSYGVYIITTWDAGHNRPTGCVANSVMQVTASPATLAVSINRDNHTCACIRESGRLAVNILGEDTDPTLIGRFGFSSGRDTAKLEGVAHRTEDGLPLLADSCGWITGRVVDSLETATHTVFLVAVTDGAPQPGTPMTYRYYHQVVKGKTAKNAPTYQPEPEPPQGEAPSWRCTVCGYVYQGDTPFEALPDTWTCPICGVGKDQFEAV